jgi:hypothetical protein
MKFVRFPAGDIGVWGVVEGDQVRPLRDTPYDPAATGAATQALSSVDLLAPVRPSKIVAVSLPGADIALIPPTARIGPGWETRLLSADSTVELIPAIVAVIGGAVRSNHTFDPATVVFGYTAGFLLNDQTIAKEQGAGLQSWGYDGYLPIGPWLETNWKPDNRPVSISGIKNVEPHGDLAPENVHLGSRTTGSFSQAVSDALAKVTAIMSLDPGDALVVPLGGPVGSFSTSFNITLAVDGLGTLEMHIHSPFDDTAGPLGPKQPVGG